MSGAAIRAGALSPRATSAAVRAADPARDTIRFSLAILVVSLCLQRFGLTFGGRFLSLVGPIGLAIAAVFLLRGTVVLHRGRTLLFLALAGWLFLGGAFRTAWPAYHTDASWPSLAQFLVLTAFACLGFTQPVDEQRFFRAMSTCFAVIAAAGILQFVAQFAGIRLFSFTGFVPGRFLIEYEYNVSIPIAGTAYLKSNGFFLLEPSIMSQMMALGLIMEVLTVRRARCLVLFAVALLMSNSGTGWLMLAAFGITVAFWMGPRGVAIAAVSAVAGLLLLGLMALVIPALYDGLIARTGELSQMGSSGHARFVTPWWVMSDVLNREPWAALYGVGAGMSERITATYAYNMNLPAKLVIEFGFPALIVYLLLLVWARHSPVQRVLVLPCMVMILIDGGVAQSPFILFPAMLLTAVAQLRPSAIPTTATRALA